MQSHEEYVMMVTVGPSNEEEPEENTEERVRRHNEQFNQMMDMLLETKQKLDEPAKNKEARRKEKEIMVEEPLDSNTDKEIEGENREL